MKHCNFIIKIQNLNKANKLNFGIMLYGLLILHSITWMLIQQDFDNIPRIILFILWGLLLGLCIQKKKKIN